MYVPIKVPSLNLDREVLYPEPVVVPTKVPSVVAEPTVAEPVVATADAPSNHFNPAFWIIVLSTFAWKLFGAR